MQINSVQQNYGKQQVGFGAGFGGDAGEIAKLAVSGKLGQNCEKAIEAAHKAVSKLGGEDLVKIGFLKDGFILKDRLAPTVSYYKHASDEKALFDINYTPLIGINKLGIAKSPNKFADFCVSVVEKGREQLKLAADFAKKFGEQSQATGGMKKTV